MAKTLSRSGNPIMGVRVSPEDFQRLRVKANQQSTTISELVRNLITAYLTRKP